MAGIMAGLLVLTLIAGLLAGTTGSNTPNTATTTPPTAGTLARVTDLPAVTVEELPVEGRDTLELIIDGGPFPYERDGATFQNREGLLPEQPPGYYREFTVPTPGEDDRGARRFVVGQNGEFFYTEDHYESFRELVVA
jgi:ribonuclease T1